MSEIAVRNNNHNAVDIQPSQDHAIARLAEWAHAADAAYTMARKLVSTQFVPQQYRGKPEEATAAILAGAEVGLSPMAALRAFDNIQGTPAPKALTLRAIVQSIGHDIQVVESTPTRAVVTGLRAGAPEEKRQTSEWTIERAQQAGYVSKNPNYKTKPAEMLVARATSEVCRWIASDAIMGMAYSSEEIRDEGPSFDARTAPPRVTAAEILGVQDVAAQPVDRDAVAQDDPADNAEPDSAVEMMTAEQRKRSFALWRDLGYDGDANREMRLTITTKILGLPEPMTTSSDLTSAEAEVLNAALQERRDAQPAGGEQS